MPQIASIAPHSIAPSSRGRREECVPARQVAGVLRSTRRDLIVGALAAFAGDLRGASPSVEFIFGTYGMKSLPVPDALKVTAEAGYDGIELCVMAGYPADAAGVTPATVRQMRSLLAGRRLTVPAVQDNLPLLAAPQQMESNRERIRRIAEIAHGLGEDRPPVLDTVLGGGRSDWPGHRSRMADELAQWARIAEGSGLTIAIKAHAGHAMNSPERALDLLRQVGSPRIRLVYDYSHFSLEGLSLEDSLRSLLPDTVLISLKDTAGTREAPKYLLPGDGATDYLQYFRLLARLGYSGPIGVEVSSMLHRQPDYDPVRTANLCYQRLAPLFTRAGLARKRNS